MKKIEGAKEGERGYEEETYIMSIDVLMRFRQLTQQMIEIIQQEQFRSSPLMSIPLHASMARPASVARPALSALNPEAKEFVPQQAVSHRVRFSDLLQQGETVYLTVGIGRYEDGYPILSTATSVYDGRAFTIHSCDDVPEMIGQSSDKPGGLLFQFIRGLKRARKLRHTPKASVWRHCYVKRNGKHISFSRLSQSYISNTNQ